MAYRYATAKVLVARILELAAWLLSPFLARRPRPGPVGRILLVEPFQMGDLVSLSAILGLLKQRFPEAEIHLLSKPANREVLAVDPRVTAGHFLPMPWTGYGGKLGRPAQWLRLLAGLWKMRRLDFDLALDTRGDIRSQIIMMLAGARQRVGYTNYLASNLVTRGLLLTRDVGPMPLLPRYEMNRLVVGRAFGFDPGPLEPPCFEAPDIEPLHPAQGRRVVLFHIGAGWIFRRWPARNWVLLINRLCRDASLLPVLICGPGEKDAMDEVAERLACQHLALQPSYGDLIGLIKGAGLFVGLDSGPLGLAAALGARVVGIFGPGESLMWRPMGENNLFIHKRDSFPCIPCLQIRCIFPWRHCMTKIHWREVLVLVERALSSPEPSGK